MPNSRVETFGGADHTWLASNHGLFNSKTFTAKAADFTAVVKKFGKIPAGYPVAVADGVVTPYTGSGTFGGHITFDQAGTFDNGVPVLIHGTVYKSKVPVASGSFTAPESQPSTSIVYL